MNLIRSSLARDLSSPGLLGRDVLDSYEIEEPRLRITDPDPKEYIIVGKYRLEVVDRSSWAIGGGILVLIVVFMYEGFTFAAVSTGRDHRTFNIYGLYSDAQSATDHVLGLLRQSAQADDYW